MFPTPEPPAVVLTASAAHVAGRIGEPGVTFVLGEFGSGKTTLAHHLLSQSDPLRWHDRLVSARLDELDDSSPADLLAQRGVRLPLRRGELLVVDGLDELRSPPSVAQLRSWLADPRLHDGHVVLTSRRLPVGRTLGQPPDLPGHPNTAVIELTWRDDELFEVLQRRGVDDDNVRAFLLDYARSTGADNARLVLQALQRMLLGRPGQQPALPITLFFDQTGRLRVAPSLTLPGTGVQLGGAAPLPARPHLTLNRSRTLWLPEADALEQLINDPDVNEAALQRFFTEHPHLLARGDYDRVLPHPVLRRSDDGPLVPDFMLEPAGEFADVLDLKLPSVPLVAGSKDRLRPTAKLADAIAQVREYHAYFEDPAHRRDFQARYRMAAYRPTAIVVIGRDTGLGSDPLQLRRVWTEQAGQVRVQTYDELLRSIRRLGRL
jgi:hypothetical protein